LLQIYKKLIEINQKGLILINFTKKLGRV